MIGEGLGGEGKNGRLKFKKILTQPPFSNPSPRRKQYWSLAENEPPSDKPIYAPDGCHSTAQFYHRLNFTLCYNIFLAHSSIIRVRVRVRVTVRVRVRFRVRVGVRV